MSEQTFIRQTARDYDLPLEIVSEIYKKDKAHFYENLELEIGEAGVSSDENAGSTCVGGGDDGAEKGVAMTIKEYKASMKMLQRLNDYRVAYVKDKPAEEINVFKSWVMKELGELKYLGRD